MNLDLDKALTCWINHINNIKIYNNKNYDGHSIGGFKSGKNTKAAYKFIFDNCIKDDNNIHEDLKDLTTSSIGTWLCKCLSLCTKDTLSETTFNFLCASITNKKIFTVILDSEKINTLISLRDSSLDKFENIQEDLSSSDDSNVDSVKDTQAQQQSSASNQNNQNIDYSLLINQLVTLMQNSSNFKNQSVDLSNHKDIDPFESNDFSKYSLSDLLNLANYRINKRIIYENHIKIFNHHLNSMESNDKTTPKQLWPNRFPYPFLVDNEKYLDEYDILITKMQKMIMDFNIKFITDNILTDLDLQLDQIKIAIASIKSTNKATKYIQNIHKENNNKLKDSLDNKYFKALRYKGIPWKKLIANKKAIAEQKDKRLIEKDSHNSVSNSNSKKNNKNNKKDLNTSLDSSNDSDNSIISINSSSSSSKSVKFKDNIKPILKKNSKKSTYNDSINDNYKNQHFNRSNHVSHNHSYRRQPNRARNFSRSKSRSFSRSRGNNRSRDNSRSRGNSRKPSNNFYETRSFNNNNNKTSFKPINYQNRHFNQNKLQYDMADEDLFNNERTYRSTSKNRSINFRHPASYQTKT